MIICQTDGGQNNKRKKRREDTEHTCSSTLQFSSNYICSTQLGEESKDGEPWKEKKNLTVYMRERKVEFSSHEMDRSWWFSEWTKEERKKINTENKKIHEEINKTNNEARKKTERKIETEKRESCRDVEDKVKEDQQKKKRRLFYFISGEFNNKLTGRYIFIWIIDKIIYLKMNTFVNK